MVRGTDENYLSFSKRLIEAKKDGIELNFITKEYGFKLEAEKVIKIAG